MRLAPVSDGLGLRSDRRGGVLKAVRAGGGRGRSRRQRSTARSDAPRQRRRHLRPHGVHPGAGNDRRGPSPGLVYERWASPPTRCSSTQCVTDPRQLAGATHGTGSTTVAMSQVTAVSPVTDVVEFHRRVTSTSVPVHLDWEVGGQPLPVVRGTVAEIVIVTVVQQLRRSARTSRSCRLRTSATRPRSPVSTEPAASAR
jgi:hypothetical protein